MELVICVYACDTIPKYKQQILKMNETYVRRVKDYPNMKLLYFLGEEQTDLSGEQYIHLKGVSNDYMSATYKQFLGMRYIYEHYDPKFVMCIGTDTYLNIPKLARFIQQFDPSRSLYIGGHGDTRHFGTRSIYFHSGGPGFILTKRCLDEIAPHLTTIIERWISLCTTHKCVDLIPACDVGIAYLIQEHASSTETVNIPGLLFTHCNYRGYPCHMGRATPQHVIACHTMSLQDFDHFTAILEKYQYFC